MTFSRSIPPLDVRLTTYDETLSPTLFYVLLGLVDSDLTGYGIMQTVKTLSSGEIVLGPSTLYRTLKTLLETGLIEESGAPRPTALQDEQRRTYRLTALGGKVIEAEIERLTRMLTAAQSRRRISAADRTASRRQAKKSI